MVAALKRRLLLLVFLIVGMAGAVIAACWLVACILFAPGGQRAWRIVIALDQLGNATTGGADGETISSRAGRLQSERGWACYLCKFLDWLQKDHCKNSIGT